MKRFHGGRHRRLLALVWAVSCGCERPAERGQEGRHRPRPRCRSALRRRQAWRDVPLTVDGIGTVQALNTVNIRPMVDGPLTEIRFREGQDVHVGDVLARIDSPAPIRRRTTRRWPRRRRMRRPWPTRSVISRGTTSSPATSMARPSKPTRSDRDGGAGTRRWCGRTRRRSTPRAPTSATRPSPRRSMAAPAYVRSILGNLVHSTDVDADHGGDDAAADLGSYLRCRSKRCRRWLRRSRRAAGPREEPGLLALPQDGGAQGEGGCGSG